MLDTSQFTGSETFYRHPLVRSVVYTEGVQYVAEQAGAYWLLDKIATEGVMDPRLNDQEFQVWKLKVSKSLITVDDGDGNILKTEKLDFTDFPEPGITLWFTGKTILLPSEY